MLILNQLTGFGVGGTEVLTTLSQIASATSTAATITAPVGIIAGDLLVLWDVAASLGSLPASVTPSGFTAIFDRPNTEFNDARGIASYKIATGAESGASLTGMDGNFQDRKALYVFRGDVPITAVNVNDVSSVSQNANPSAQVVNAAGAQTPLLVLGFYAIPFSGSVDPRTFNPTKDGEINPNTSLYLAYKIYNSAPADVTIDMDDEGDENFLGSCYITCS